MAMAAMAEAAAAAMAAEQEMEQEKSRDQASDVSAKLQNAVFTRAKYIREEAESLTMGNFRRLLEQDLGLKPFELDPYKKQIKKLVDEVLSSDGPSSNADDQPEQESEENAQPMKKEANGNNSQAPETSKEGEPESDECNEAVIRDAIVKRRAYLMNEGESITFQRVRRLLEQDLDLQEFSLDAKKKLIKRIIDEVLSSSGGSPAPKEKALKKVPEERTRLHQEKKRKLESKSKPNKKGPVRREKVSDESENGSAEENHSDRSDSPRPSKKKISKGSDGKVVLEETQSDRSDSPDRRPVKKKVSKGSDVKPVQNKLVEHLKQMIKSCGMNIPPSVYKRIKQAPEGKREDALVKELESILKREGLDRNSSEKEIKAVRKRKEKQKDLEGIDVGNIIIEGRGRRQASSFYAPVCVEKKKTDPDDEDSEKSNMQEEEPQDSE